MKQIPFPFITSTKKQFGGSLLLGKRRRRRPLDLKKPHHLVLKSEWAQGKRNLLRHRLLIESVLLKAARRFSVRIYEKGVAGNHIHLLVKGTHRTDLQNFFRVAAGHIAQGILREHPLTLAEKKTGGGASLKSRGGASSKDKSKNKFWLSRIFSDVISWGRHYKAVLNYVKINAEEALWLKPFFRPFKKRKQHSNDNSS